LYVTAARLQADDVAMTVFTFTCPRCGLIKVIPMTQIRLHQASPPSHWCPACGAPVTVVVEYDHDAPTGTAGAA